MATDGQGGARIGNRFACITRRHIEPGHPRSGIGDGLGGLAIRSATSVRRSACRSYCKHIKLTYIPSILTSPILVSNVPEIEERQSVIGYGRVALGYDVRSAVGDRPPNRPHLDRHSGFGHKK